MYIYTYIYAYFKSSVSLYSFMPTTPICRTKIPAGSHEDFRAAYKLGQDARATLL